jgi:hypothetical protein
MNWSVDGLTGAERGAKRADTEVWTTDLTDSAEGGSLRGC